MNTESRPTSHARMRLRQRTQFSDDRLKHALENGYALKVFVESVSRVHWLVWDEFCREGNIFVRDENNGEIITVLNAWHENKWVVAPNLLEFSIRLTFFKYSSLLTADFLKNLKTRTGPNRLKVRYVVSRGVGPCQVLGHVVDPRTITNFDNLWDNDKVQCAARSQILSTYPAGATMEQLFIYIKPSYHYSFLYPHIDIQPLPESPIT